MKYFKLFKNSFVVLSHFFFKYVSRTILTFSLFLFKKNVDKSIWNVSLYFCFLFVLLSFFPPFLLNTIKFMFQLRRFSFLWYFYYNTSYIYDRIIFKEIKVWLKINCCINDLLDFVDLRFDKIDSSYIKNIIYWTLIITKLYHIKKN